MKIEYFVPTVFGLLCNLMLSAQAGEGSARFLYLEHCGDAAMTKISIEILKTEQGAWTESGQKWDHPPLLANEAACFDTADMYSDVPEGVQARLKLEFETGDPVICAATRVDKSKPGDLRLFTYLSLPLASDTFFFEEGCHAQAYLGWHPPRLCTGKGERLPKIKCQY